VFGAIGLTTERIRKNPLISHAMEDYLKAIYELSEGDDLVSTNRVAEHMKCTPASVTNMLQKLSTLRLLNYVPYHGVRLSSTGRKIALEIVRHHRLIELYLSRILGYSWDKVHEEADQLEHVISEEFEARIDEILGYPKVDPHGAPIPTKEGHIPDRVLLCLWDLQVGEAAIIRSVNDRNPAVLRHLADLQIYPDVEIHVKARDPFDGPIHIEVKERSHSLSEKLARQIWVEAM
jgi:DtxR family Mn-dependent transcriptional regulator